MDEPSIAPICQVCSDTSASSHFGALTCRGCSAFFRRSIVENKTFKCLINNNCVIHKSQKYHCKKCRLQKCFDVGMLVAGIKGKRVQKEESKHRYLEIPRQEISEEIEEIREPLLLKKLISNYKILCDERRRTEEALFAEQHQKALQNVNNPVPGYFPCTVESIRLCNKVHFSAVVQYLCNSFEEFAELTEEQKWTMIKPFHVYLQWLDACYFTYLHLPPEMYPDYLITSALSYWDPKAILHTFFSIENAPYFIKERLINYMPEFVSKETRTDKIRLTMEMKRLGIDEIEYSALVGLMFWNTNIDNSLEILPLITRVRAKILKDFGLYYKNQGLDYPEIRQGEIISLVGMILIDARKFRNKLQLFNVFEMLDKDDYFYKLIHDL